MLCRAFLMIFLGFFVYNLTKILRKKSFKKVLSSLLDLTRCLYETVTFKGGSVTYKYKISINYEKTQKGLENCFEIYFGFDLN